MVKNYSGTEEEASRRDQEDWDGKIGPRWKKGGEHKQKKLRNQVKGVGSSTYKVIAHISLHPIPPHPAQQLNHVVSG